jgi:hypothetical protein
MAGPRTPRFDGALRSRRFAGAAAPRVDDFCRSVLPTLIANSNPSWLIDTRGRPFQRCLNSAWISQNHMVCNLRYNIVYNLRVIAPQTSAIIAPQGASALAA